MAQAQQQQPPAHLEYRKYPPRRCLSLCGLFYLANLWNNLREAFNLRQIPNVAITMGFPSRKARSKSSNRAPGEILIEEWVASGAEKALVSIHPERFESAEQVALSTLFVIGNEVYGSRRNLGSLSLGVTMNKETGDLMYTDDEKGKHATGVLGTILKSLGEIPEGFAEMPEPKTRTAQTNRQLKFECGTCHQIIRSAGNHLEVLCMHGGKPEHGQPAAPFMQVQKAQVAVKPASDVVEAPQPVAPLTDTQNRINLGTLVRSGAAKIASHARNFGTEQVPA